MYNLRYSFTHKFIHAFVHSFIHPFYGCAYHLVYVCVYQVAILTSPSNASVLFFGGTNNFFRAPFCVKSSSRKEIHTCNAVALRPHTASAIYPVNVVLTFFVSFSSGLRATSKGLYVIDSILPALLLHLDQFLSRQDQKSAARATDNT